MVNTYQTTWYNWSDTQFKQPSTRSTSKCNDGYYNCNATVIALVFSNYACISSKIESISSSSWSSSCDSSVLAGIEK